MTDAPDDEATTEYTAECRRQYLELTLPRLSEPAIRTWLALCLYGRRKKSGFTECWPSMKSLCRATGLHRATVSRGIRELTAIGWLRSWRTRTSNAYRLTDSAPDVSRAFRVFLFDR